MKILKKIILIGSSYNPSNGMKISGWNKAIIEKNGVESFLYMGDMSPKAIVEYLEKDGYDCSAINKN